MFESAFKRGLWLVVLWLLHTTTLWAQPCAGPAPRISPEGGLILCPFTSGQIEVPTGYDSYQWYKDNVPMPGETLAVLNVADTLTPYQFYCVVTEGNCTYHSDTVWVDSYVFLLPYVIHGGDPGTVDPNTLDAYFCHGDTLILELGMPYRVNIQWFKNGQPIPGADSSILVVTETGSYTVEGAPEICPNFVLGLGLDIPVVFHPKAAPQLTTAGPYSVCPNGVLEIFTNYGDSLLWSHGQRGSIGNITQPGSYWVTLKANQCTSDTTWFTVAAAPPYSKPTGTSNSPVVVGDTIRLQVQNPQPNLFYRWRTPSGQIIFGTQMEVLNAQATDGGSYLLQQVGPGCQSEPDTLPVVVQSATSIDPVGSGRLQLYPNPTTGVVNLTLPEGLQQGTLEVLSLNGAVLLHKSLEAGTATVDLNALGCGLYLLRFRAAQGSVLHERVTVIRP